MSKKTKIICVVGPTASGKTALGVDIAFKYNGEVISADSMQIYKGIHIASAAPNIEETKGVKHHLIEFLEMDESFTVADYVAVARAKISEITQSGKIPIIVGGTGLYINSLVDGIEFTPTKTDTALREELNQRFEELGGEEMLSQLRELDPNTAQKLHPNDCKRIVRAFEIYYSTGKTMEQINAASKTGEVYDALMLGITYENREKLYDRVNRRVDIMLENGLLEEAKEALNNTSGGAIQAIGHKELFPYLKGEASLEQVTEALKQATRRYAKRQLTWFRKDERINWIYADKTDCVLDTAGKIIDEWRESN